MLKATGQGAPDLNAPSIAVARLGAEKAALAMAQRNALETLKGAALEGGGTVGALLQNDSALRSKVQAKLRSLRAAKTHYYSDGGISLEVELPLDQLPLQIADNLKPSPHSSSSPSTFPSASPPTSTSPSTSASTSTPNSTTSGPDAGAK